MDENFKTIISAYQNDYEKISSIEYNESNHMDSPKSIHHNLQVEENILSKDKTNEEISQLIFFAPKTDFQEITLQNALFEEGFQSISNICKLNSNLAVMETSSLKKAIEIIVAFHEKQLKAKQQQPAVLTLSSREAIKFCEFLLSDINFSSNLNCKSQRTDGYQNKHYKKHSNFSAHNRHIITNTKPVEIIIEEIPGGVDSNDLLSVFSRCGRVEDIKTFPNSKEDSQNYASIVYSNMSMAQKAIRCLDGKYKMNENSKPLSVKLMNVSN